MINCPHCSDLFKEFIFEDLGSVIPPRKPGVYIIKVKKKGQSPNEVLKIIYKILDAIDWNIVKKYVGSRVDRTEKIETCDIIYIGKGDNLYERYDNFKGVRHTAMFPVWLLLYLGWELEYGLLIDDNPKDKEKELKESYKDYHQGKYPALVET